MTISNQASGTRPGVCTSTTRPTTPYTGMLIYETDTGYLRVWDGSAWDYLSQKQDDTVGLGPVGGLVYITSGSFTGVTTAAPLAVTSVWNSTYDNYKIHLKMQGSGNANLLMRYYTGTNTLNTDANYSMSGYNASGSTLTGVGEYNQTRTYFSYVFGASTDYTYFDCDVFSPNLATETGMRGFTAAVSTGATWAFSSSTGHYKNSANQYTGFQIYPDFGTLIGSYTVYGYRKS